MALRIEGSGKGEPSGGNIEKLATLLWFSSSDKNRELLWRGMSGEKESKSCGLDSKKIWRSSSGKDPLKKDCKEEGVSVGGPQDS